MKFNKSVLVLSSLLIISLPMAAAQQSQVGPGMIGAESPFYGLETGWDNAAVLVGMKKASTVAQERAAEARRAVDKGNWKAARKAADNMADVAKKAKGNETQSLQKAESVLQGVMENAPEEARQGLQTALENVQRERGRVRAEPGQTPGGQPGQEAPTQDQENRPNSTEESGNNSGTGTESPPEPPQ